LDSANSSSENDVGFADSGQRAKQIPGSICGEFTNSSRKDKGLTKFPPIGICKFPPPGTGIRPATPDLQILVPNSAKFRIPPAAVIR